MDVIFIVAGLAAAIYFFKSLAHTKGTAKTAALFMLSGLGSLIVSGIITSFASQCLSVNETTVFISLVCGIPGVIMMLIKLYLL